jgi:enoyl-[acyl-carrier protein] reductase I
MTYLNEKAKPHVEPLAKELEASIFMPLDVSRDGRLEAVFERIGAEWGKLDILVHIRSPSRRRRRCRAAWWTCRATASSTMDVSCWSFIRMAHLAEPLMKDGGTLLTMTYYGSQMVVENYNIMGVKGGARILRALSRDRTRAEGHPRARDLAPGRSRRAPPRGSPNSTSCSTRAKEKAPARALVTSTTSAWRPSCARRGEADHRADALRRRRLHIIELALSDRAFRSLCEDYALARASLTSFQARADARERPEIADYRTVIAELEGEIARALTVAGRRR